MIDIKVPEVGESITEVTLVQWLKEDGAWVERDEVICELESEKATFELNAEEAGILHHVAKEDDDLNVGDVAAQIDETATQPGNAGSTPTAAPVMEETQPELQPTPAVVETAPQPEPVATQTVESNIGGSSEGKMIEIKIPEVGESITEVTLVQWLKEDGAWVERDEVLCELESEKASFELNAEESGILHQMAKVDDDLAIGAVACTIETGAARPAGAPAPAPKVEAPKAQPEAPKAAPVAAPATPKPVVEAPKPAPAQPASVAANKDLKATPVAKAMMTDKKVDPSTVKGSGSLGKILKEDVLFALEHPGMAPGQPLNSREEKVEKMSRLRRTISRRLVEAKNGTAMLTTFNEVDMSAVMDIRKQYKQEFLEKTGVKLGFMSFFTKACCIALMEWPAVNAYIDGESLIYHDYCDISIAVSSPKGLVVPVIRNAESLSMAGIEDAVATLAKKARSGQLTIEEMTGGTFTITNGGVFGSLMSTPILNQPQSAILGMHKIEERPVVINHKVEVRPMMYLALSYDHRVIDGRESVSFLVRVKELLEHPEQMIFRKDPVKALLNI